MPVAARLCACWLRLVAVWSACQRTPAETQCFHIVNLFSPCCSGTVLAQVDKDIEMTHMNLNRRHMLALLGASTLVAGCGRWPRNTNRAASEGIIVRPKPVAQANMMELVPEGDTVFLSGTINDDSTAALRVVQEANPELRRVVFLEAEGETGSDAGIALGQFLREEGLETHLRNDSRVSGAAVDAYLGGTQRSYEEGAMVGALRGQAGSEAHVAYVTQMTGGDGYARYAAQFGGRRRPTPMTIAEIGAMGVITRSQESIPAAN